MRRRVIGGGALLAAAGAAVAIGAGGDDRPAPAAASAGTATELVERRDLVDRENATGTLGYADRSVLTAAGGGTLTGVRADGAVVRRGSWLYEVDGEHTGWLLYGSRPPWRDFAPGMSDGSDVRALERNLRALGYEPGEVDGDWDADTTAAVKRFQDDRGLTEDGGLRRAELVFRPGATRVGETKGRIGGPASGEIADLASTRREVTVDLDADRQEVAREGASVVVELPTGRTVRGRVAEVGTVAKTGGQDAPPTISVRVALRGRAARAGGLDQAPVDVGFERERAKDALTVPIGALLARPGGRYAVEVPQRGLVEVTPGLFADGYVAVEGDLRDGERVVVPA